MRRMKCRNCPEGRRFTAESVYCIRYGMIIREDHECRQIYEGVERVETEGGVENGEAADQRDGGTEQQAEAGEGGRGAA